ncbi:MULTISPECIES: 4Fe-4S dicluster domain-containing protein [Campylobacter]|uniref:4Fe-4S dicluster domain-containing protein n=1 Tax=Campylobacter TaxID=194 RepID=UPI000BB41B86|nr:MULTISPECIES: 4Fe-4S dicluster domain-containing protein [Campylobacter]
MNRREFGIFSLIAIGGAVGGGMVINKFYEPKSHLRPPGGVENFESLCIKCGQCVQVCPYHSINLLGFDDGINLATAYIDPNKRGCYLCDLFPCILACPSGALDHNTNSIKDIKMGVAIIKDIDRCYANKKISKSDVSSLLERKTYNQREHDAKQIIEDNIDKTCSLCVSSCLVDNAINFIKINDKNIVNISPNCVGCGVCQEVCFANVIEILPNKSYKDIYGD